MAGPLRVRYHRKRGAPARSSLDAASESTRPGSALMLIKAVQGLQLDIERVAQSAGSVKRNHLVDDERLIQTGTDPTAAATRLPTSRDGQPRPATAAGADRITVAVTEASEGLLSAHPASR
jgi:hypothetical protein